MEKQNEKEVVRPLHELYELLYDSIKDRDCVGMLCFIMCELDISYLEINKIRTHFYSQQPSANQHVEFYNNLSFGGMASWWKNHHAESTEQRKLFIQKMIEITKPKQQ